MSGVRGAPAMPLVRIGWPRTVVPHHVRRRLLAALLAAAAVVLALASVRAPAPGVSVAVAARDLPAGSRLAAGDVRLVNLPAAAVPAGAAHSVSAVVGQVVSGGLRARELLTDARLSHADIATGLAPGQVAAPVRFADSGIASLLRPGARVDVFAAATGPDGSQVSAASAAQSVAQDVEVLAVPPAGGTGDGQGALVVLAVSTFDAQRLAGAEAGGRLSVALRPSAPPG